MNKPIIALITDFSYIDNYVGVIKGVINSINPDSNIVDISHGIAPQNIHQAAYMLLTSFDYFPENAIFLTIVDPGVGSNRQPICVKIENKYIVTPNNGIISYIAQKYTVNKIIELNNHKFHLENISKTFHGRDVFAPVAAWLSTGISLDNLGTALPKESIISCFKIKAEINLNNNLEGNIIYIDTFGNIVTSITANDLNKYSLNYENLNIIIENNIINSIKDTYSSVNDNELLAYIGSNGFLEIALRNGNAMKYLNADYNSRVYIDSIKLNKEL